MVCFCINFLTFNIYQLIPNGFITEYCCLKVYKDDQMFVSLVNYPFLIKSKKKKKEA